MADSTDKDKSFAPVDEALRKLIEEKVQRAKEKLLKETAASSAKTEQSSVIPVTENKLSDPTRKAVPIPSEPSETAERNKPPAADYVAIGDQQRDALRKTAEARLQSKKLFQLDATGTWRKHVWLLAEHKVQEVTLKYAVYYGIPLSEKESKEFVRAVLGI